MNGMNKLIYEILDRVKGFQDFEAIDLVLFALEDYQQELQDLLDGGVISYREYLINLAYRANEVSVIIEIIRRTNNVRTIATVFPEGDRDTSEHDGNSLAGVATFH